MKFLEWWEKFSDKNEYEKIADQNFTDSIPSINDSHATALACLQFGENVTYFFQGISIALALINNYGIPEDLNEIKLTRKQVEQMIQKEREEREEEIRNSFRRFPRMGWGMEGQQN